MKVTRAARRESAGRGRVVALAAVLLAAGAVGVATADPWGSGSRPAGSSTPAPDPRATPSSATTRSSGVATAARPPATPVPGPETVVALGDSVTAGSACGCTPFPERYAAGLGTRVNAAVSAVNLGQSGLTTAGLLQQLGGRGIRAALSTADTVVVTIGANDLLPLTAQWESAGCEASCVRPAIDQMEQGLAGALARVRADGGGTRRLLVTTYWNVFEDGDVADALHRPGFADWSDGVTRAANAAICRDAAAAAATCVDLYSPFEGVDGQRNPTTLLADDGDHPNAAGHAVIAAALLRAAP